MKLEKYFYLLRRIRVNNFSPSLVCAVKFLLVTTIALKFKMTC